MPFESGDEVPETARKTARKTANKTIRKPRRVNPAEIRASILDLLRANPRLTRSDIAIALSISKGNAHHYLDSLKKQGLIERAGSCKTGHWVVNRK